MANKVSPGQKVKQLPTRKASFNNDLVDVVNWFKGGGPGGSRTATADGGSTDKVKIRNLTGDNLPRGSIVQLGEYLLDELDPNNLWFAADYPAAPLYLGYAVLRKPIKNDEIGPAQASGVCTARVDVVDENHKFAGPTSGSALLTSAHEGPVEILQDPDGTGEQELVVRLLSAPGSIVCAIDIASDGDPLTATVTARPPGMTKVPEEDGGEIEVSNEADITIPEDGLSGYAVYLNRDGTKQWELIAEDDESEGEPPSGSVSNTRLYAGVTTVWHLLNDTQTVTVDAGGSPLGLSSFNPLYVIPPGVTVVVAKINGDWTIISAAMHGMFGKASTTYAKDEDNASFAIYRDPDLTGGSLGTLTGVWLPFGGMAGGDAAWISWNGFEWIATARECDS